MKVIWFLDKEKNDHFVNTAYIVQLHSKKYVKWDRNGHKEREYTAYYVNVACAGVAVYHAEEIEIDRETFITLSKQLIKTQSNED